jgi:hypothetical protein
VPTQTFKARELQSRLQEAAAAEAAAGAQAPPSQQGWLARCGARLGWRAGAAARAPAPAAVRLPANVHHRGAWLNLLEVLQPDRFLEQAAGGQGARQQRQRQRRRQQQQGEGEGAGKLD